MQYLKKYYIVYVLLFAAFAGGAMFFSRAAQQVLPVTGFMPDEGWTVVIDAGHGGEDGGAVSPNGTRECELNLQISLRVNDLLHLLGRKTVMIRSEDQSIYDDNARTVSEKKVSDLRNRAAIVNETPHALFISIHQNMFSDGKYSGAQVFYAKTDGSEELAKQLQSLLREQLDPSNHRETKQSNAVWLMEHIDCAGILVECGFLSNAEEEQRLKTADYQKKLSCVLACGISQYLIEEKENHEI